MAECGVMMIDRQQRRWRLLLARHALRTRVAAIEGWSQLLRRERRKPQPDEARLRQLEATVATELLDLETDIDRQTGDVADADADVTLTGDERWPTRR
jgi:hypothetical protein